MSEQNASWLVALALFGCGAIYPASAQTVTGCGSLATSFGPFDYRDPVVRQTQLPLVEPYHFTPEVESLIRGKSGTIIGDLTYTLRVFPNHHRALNSISTYALRGGRFPPDGIPSADCFFKRAITFTRDDETVHMLYGSFLAKSGRKSEATDEYRKALDLAPESAEVNYNLGLFYIKNGDLERAKQHAKVAYEAGYPLPGLQRMIDAAEAGRKSADD